MLSNIIDNPVLVNNPVPLLGQIRVCSRFLGDNNPFVCEALRAVAKHGQQDNSLTKSGLFDIWSDTGFSFAAKCLVTLWWGYPDHRVAARVYSQENLDKLSAGRIERSFNTLKDEKEFSTFKNGLENLYRDFSRGGEFHLNGIGVSFFTKFFHFYFASHPPKSNPNFLPVIADDIIRMAVFSEMIDRGEDVNDIFFCCDASLRSYTDYADKFNAFAADYPNITPFVLEDILFSRSKGLGSTYVSAYNSRLSLPHWIAGRFNLKEQVAIVFNNLKGETYLFEGPTAQLWNELLNYEYGKPFDVDAICATIGCSLFDLNSFFKELLDQKIIVDHDYLDAELSRIKKSVNKAKRRFLKSDEGIGNYRSSYESVDNDYRNIITSQGIPFAASIEMTYACNEACIHCYNPNSPRDGGIGAVKPKPKGEMMTEEYFSVLDSLKNLGVAKVVLTGGDPFMKKGFMDILDYAHKLKFAISVYTNGQALSADRDLYKRLRETYPQYVGLSLYSTIPEVHDSITRRKGSCEKTKEVARMCYEDAIGLQIKCPIMRANKDSYGEVFKFALEVNGMPEFDVNITSSVDGDCFAPQQLRLTEEQLKEVLKDPRIPLSVENNVGAIERKPEMMFCGAGESSFNIQPDGTVTPCCAFPLNCGNVREREFDSIWEDSFELRKIRTLRYRDSDKCGKEKYCKYCNRCIGQSYIEYGKPEIHSNDNCFLAKIRYALANNTR